MLVVQFDYTHTQVGASLLNGLVIQPLIGAKGLGLRVISTGSETTMLGQTVGW